MAYELKPNTGSVFKNMKKEKDTHPDLKGEALIDGKYYWVSGWKKTDKNQNTWISFAVTEKQDKPSEGYTETGGRSFESKDTNDEIPF